jgi:thioredoxin reductase
MHGFLTREDIRPEVFRQTARADLTRYDTIHQHRREVISARRLGDGTFEAHLQGGRRVRARKLLIATGVFDQVPAIEGFLELFGRGVFQCPYCDGWEVRGAGVAAYGKRTRGYEMARALTAWTRDIVLCTNGPARLTPAQLRHLRANGIEVIEEPILRVESRRGRLHQLRFRSGRALPRAAVFFDTPSRPQSPLARSLGCQFARHGGIRCGAYEASSVPGVFVAWNILKDVQLAIVAASEGARAAFGINRSLTREDFEKRATGRKRIEHPPLDSR